MATKMDALLHRNIPRSMREVALAAGWPTWKMRRLIQKLDRMTGGGIIMIDPADDMRFPKQKVNIARLLSVYPGFGRSVPTETDLDEVRDVEEEHSRQLRELAREVRVLKARVDALEQKKRSPVRLQPPAGIPGAGNHGVAAQRSR